MRHKILNYNPELKELARKLRKNSTLSEKLLWNYLKGKQINGFDFDLDNYIVDFYCKELMLAIEIDGFTHSDKMDSDKKRQQRLEKLGIKFFRFTDTEVRESPEGVAHIIKEWTMSFY
jgi:very-short-patch-repair endonuclease